MDTIFLFDIDGVLVEPRGYQAAYMASIHHFTHPLDLPEALLPSPDLYSFFEARQITSEWDMVPISLAILVDALLGENPDQFPPPEIGSLSGFVPARLPQAIDYYGMVRRLAAYLRPGEYPAETALRHPELFPHLALSPLWPSLLAGSRQVDISRTTRIFQHFSLGSQAFQLTYAQPAEINVSSMLKEKDIPRLPAELFKKIVHRAAAGRLSVAAYTQRPSLPPREIPGPLIGYAPEAEMALELVGLRHIPLIGYGRIRYLAEQTGVDAELYLKPSPVQALAAIFAALTRREEPSLHMAARFYAGDSQMGIPPELSPLKVHVFEDSAGGIQAVRRAVELLRVEHCEVEMVAWGIAQHAEKVAALERIQVPVYPTTAAAVEQALSM